MQKKAKRVKMAKNRTLKQTKNNIIVFDHIRYERYKHCN